MKPEAGHRVAAHGTRTHSEGPTVEGASSLARLEGVVGLLPHWGGMGDSRLWQMQAQRTAWHGRVCWRWRWRWIIWREMTDGFLGCVVLEVVVDSVWMGPWEDCTCISSRLCKRRDATKEAPWLAHEGEKRRTNVVAGIGTAMRAEEGRPTSMSAW